MTVAWLCVAFLAFVGVIAALPERGAQFVVAGSWLALAGAFVWSLVAPLLGA